MNSITLAGMLVVRVMGMPVNPGASVIPGQRSSRIYIVDTADVRRPKIHKVIEPEEIKEKTNLTAPHTVHCLADGNIMISMLGDSEGNAPGGFLLLDDNFEIAGRWERKPTQCASTMTSGISHAITSWLVVSGAHPKPTTLALTSKMWKLEIMGVSCISGIGRNTRLSKVLTWVRKD
jgi:hypothetical protein